MNLIGINETIAPSTAFPTDEELQQAINRTHELGGIAVLNHWAWSHFTGYLPIIKPNRHRNAVRQMAYSRPSDP